ncbi:MAG: hypothetical protein WCI11_13715 [Candidatus Methylumidiphilus sp.]
MSKRQETIAKISRLPDSLVIIEIIAVLEKMKPDFPIKSGREAGRNL